MRFTLEGYEDAVAFLKKLFDDMENLKLGKLSNAHAHEAVKRSLKIAIDNATESYDFLKNDTARSLLDKLDAAASFLCEEGLLGSEDLILKHADFFKVLLSQIKAAYENKDIEVFDFKAHSGPPKVSFRDSVISFLYALQDDVIEAKPALILGSYYFTTMMELYSKQEESDDSGGFVKEGRN